MAVPADNHDLHGNAPDNSKVALVLLDVINDFDFPGGDELLQAAEPIAPRLQKLKARAQAAGIPVIYVNDNFGRWQSNFTKLVEHCLDRGPRARQFVELLRPGEQDYFVLKPKHSGFFGTTLELLVRYLQVETLILTGLTGDMCVMFTAQDAYLRDLRLVVPSDCVVSVREEDNRYSLAHMERVLKADIRPSTKIDLQALLNPDWQGDETMSDHSIKRCQAKSK